MKIPDLFDWTNPTAPKWAEVQPTQEELESVFESCVMLIGFDPRAHSKDSYVVLGTGFIISAEGKLTILSAAHILSWWTDQIRPPSNHALRGVRGDKLDAIKRIRYVVENNYIVVAVGKKRFGNGVIYPIQHISANYRTGEMDIAILQVPLPEGEDASKYTTLRFDADPVDFQRPVIMAGYVGGGKTLALGEGEVFPTAYWEQKLVLRAGRIAEYVSDPDHRHRYEYRVSIPSLPGMSGGPLITLRPINRNLAGSYMEPTAIGVVSSSGFAEPFLVDHAEEGDTWVVPIAHTLARKVETPEGICTLSEAIKNGHIDAYGQVAHAAVVERDPETGHLNYRLQNKTGDIE